MLHNKIWESDQFSSLNTFEKLLYIGIITFSDDDGRFRAQPKFLSSRIFPYNSVTVNRVKKARDRLEEVGLIKLYRYKNNDFGYHPNWERYQSLRKDRLKLSTIPPFPTTKCQPNDNQMSAQDKVSKDKKKEDKEMSSSFSFNEILSGYQEKIGAPSENDLTELKSLTEKHGDWVLKAIIIANKKGKDLIYVKGILNNWEKGGYPQIKPKPYFSGSPMTADLRFVIVDGEKKEFAGKEADIEWKDE